MLQQYGVADFKDGNGTIATDSGVLDNAQYSFSTRFEEGKGTDPEELIAAAHAGCFSMALSGQSGNAGLTAESINRLPASLSKKPTRALRSPKYSSMCALKFPERLRKLSTPQPTTPKRDVQCLGF